MGRKKKKKKKGHKNRSSDPVDSAPTPIREARNLIASHRAILPGTVTSPAHIGKGIYRIEAVIEVALPSRVKNEGISKTGVRAREPIILDFPKEYPFLSPAVKIRKDFNRSLPHIYPGNPDGYVQPCIYEGDINELLHQENGIYGILDQLSDWLRKAAADQLIDPKQGWEPIRRDDIHGLLCFDIDKLRANVSHNENFVTFLCGFRFRNIPSYFTGFVLEHEISRHIKFKAKQVDVKTQGEMTSGVTMGILSWPTAFNTDKTPFTTDTYLPETIRTLRDLLDRAKSYGNYKSLYERIQEIYLEIHDAKRDVPDGFMLVVILCARRPFNLIKEDSNLELIPYLIKCKKASSPFLNIDLDSLVYWLGHRYQLTTSLLRRMSGSRKSVVKAPIIQIGCGSVGSKVVVHLSRSGHGPFVLIDNKGLSPHNAARHALIDINEFTIFNNKAEELKKAISIYPEARSSTAIGSNAIEILNNPQKAKEIVSSSAGLIIDSTASLAVRESLASADRVLTPIMQTTLYSNGECGICSVEGASRNPRIDDIVNKLYDSCIDDKQLAKKLLSEEGGITRQAVGQGCDSYTMVIPDTIVSIFAASMAERAKQLLENGIPSKGELGVGFLSDDHLGLTWRKYEVGESTILRGDSAWEIRILENVVIDMAKEAFEWGMTETGGVMIGRLSVARRCLTITRLLPAPPDSTRSESVFVLGTEGLRDMVQRTQRACNNLFYYVGTWHSHPRGGGPSPRDYEVMRRMKEMRLGAPAICLVWTPTGFHCVMDEGDFKI